MSKMFFGCTSLEKLDISKMHTDTVESIEHFFYECKSLKELNLSNFNTNNVKNMFGMFSRCSNQLQNKIRARYKNIKKEAFTKI